MDHDQSELSSEHCPIYKPEFFLFCLSWRLAAPTRSVLLSALLITSNTRIVFSQEGQQGTYLSYVYGVD